MSENTDMVYMEKGEDGVAVVYLNQPKKKNAINATMMDLLTECFHTADEDPEVRAIVLRGSGNCFTSGGDLSQSSPEENTPEHARKTYRKYCRTVTAMRTIAKPIVAMVDGYAVGGGFALMLASDLVCVSETATVIPAFCQIGIAPEMGVVKFLPELVGMQRAKEILACDWASSALRTAWFRRNPSRKQRWNSRVDWRKCPMRLSRWRRGC